MSERVTFDDNGLIISRSVDVTGAMRKAQMLRETQAAPMADSVCIGSIDAEMLYSLAKQAGVRPDDTEAFEDFATKLLLDRDYSKFRVYEGQT